METLTKLLGTQFDMVEATYELLVGAFQRTLGVDTIKATSIYKREEEVANLICEMLFIFCCNLHIYLCNLLLYLCPHILLLFPVEACCCSLLTNTERLDHCGERLWHAT